ncbi:MAG: hypothetical protein E4H01_08490 [Lysobacterales bacterium]|nr:MAG: hypothetical protein E4H01_08490 [Xanthomonadales bacterium]
MNDDVIGLISAIFPASAVEVVEAFTIVLAMGITRGWRSALAGTAAALLTLGLLTVALGVTLREYVNASLLQFIVGTLLLVFGLQWLRKAILRSAGLKSLHDENRIYAEELALARAAASEHRFGIDGFGFVVSFKGVLLEGLEVVFIVITFGLGAAHRGIPDAMWIASMGALAAAAAVVVAGAIVRRPLAMVPENAMKYVVGLLLSSFGVFWVVEGIGFFGPAGKSLVWPGELLALGVIIFGWFSISRVIVVALRRLDRDQAEPDASGAGG